MTQGKTAHMHAKLARQLPEPLPAIHPVPERDATGPLKRTYSETRETLQVPWMGVVTMALAHYSRFYDTLWQGLKPLYQSREFTDACQRLREQVETAIDDLRPKPLENDLLKQGYSKRELNEIRELIEIFSHGNAPYLLIASQARLLLEGHPLSTDQTMTPSRPVAASEVSELILLEEHHGNNELRDLYRRIKTTLGLPFVNTDYRALARWPSYLELAWQNLSAHIHSEAYSKITYGVHATALQLATELPNPGALQPIQLSEAAEKDASHHEVLEVARLFQYLLPGLMANIAFFRAQLE